MMSVKTLALSGAATLCLALALSITGPAAASQLDSTAAERAQTQQLNQNITDANAAADTRNDQNNAVYQVQQDRYQEQLRLYKASQTNYEERAASYLAARDRYIAGHARYHRAAWPVRYDHRLIVDTNDLLGARVNTSNGRMIGHVSEIALASGRVDALRVTLDNSKGDVWIESADLRFDSDKRLVITNLNRRDLYEMTHETY
jgi:hypothetical protein